MEIAMGGVRDPRNPTVWGKALHLYTFWSALVIFPLVYATVSSGAFQQSAVASLVMIFPEFWCIPAWFSGKFLRHRMAVGTTRFELVDGPASPGGLLRGSVWLERPPPMRKSGDGDLTSTEKI